MQDHRHGHHFFLDENVLSTCLSFLSFPYHIDEHEPVTFYKTILHLLLFDFFHHYPLFALSFRLCTLLNFRIPSLGCYFTLVAMLNNYANEIKLAPTKTQIITKILKCYL